MKEEIDKSMVSSLKLLMQKRRSALKILAAFREWKTKTTKFKWTRLFLKHSKHGNSWPKDTTVVKKREVSRRSLQLASESYKFMIENPDLEDIIVVEQC